MNRSVLHKLFGCLLLQIGLLTPLAAQQQTFYGWLDGLFPFEMTLELSSDEKSGEIKWADDEVIALVGKKSKGKIALEERSESDAVMGKYELTKMDSGLEGHWVNEKIAQPIVLLFEDTPFTPYVAHWTSTSEEAWNLVIQSVNRNQIQGAFFSIKENRYYSIKGKDYGEDGLFYSLYDANGKDVGRAQTASKEATVMPLQIEDGPTEFVKLKPQSLPAANVELINNRIAQIHFLYPKLNHFYFDRWIAEQFLPLWERAKNYEEKVGAGNFQKNLRAKLQARGHCLVNYLDENFIAGDIDYWDSWSSKKVAQSFVFDLKRGIPVTMEELINDEEGFKTFVKQKITSAYAEEKEKLLQEWLISASFDQWTLRPNGIWWGTSFHPIFGKAGTEISFEEMSPFLKSTHPFRK